MIPRRFFWLFGFLILSAAFLAAYSLVPRLAPLFAPGGPLLHQSRARIVVGSFLAPLASLSLAMLVLLSGGGLPRRLAGSDFLADYRNMESAKYAAE
jgi:hypothetical protein